MCCVSGSLQHLPIPAQAAQSSSSHQPQSFDRTGASPHFSCRNPYLNNENFNDTEKKKQVNLVRNYCANGFIS